MKYLTALLMMVGHSVAAEDYTLGSLIVTNAYSYTTTGKTGAGYFTLTNGGAADVLLSVEASFPRVMMHESKMEDSVMVMVHLMTVDVPESGRVEFAPGGYHIMFMGLKDNLDAGDQINATLNFKNAGPLAVTFEVKDR